MSFAGRNDIKERLIIFTVFLGLVFLYSNLNEPLAFFNPAKPNPGVQGSELGFRPGAARLEKIGGYGLPKILPRQPRSR